MDGRTDRRTDEQCDPQKARGSAVNKRVCEKLLFLHDFAGKGEHKLLFLEDRLRRHTVHTSEITGRAISRKGRVSYRHGPHQGLLVLKSRK